MTIWTRGAGVKFSESNYTPVPKFLNLDLRPSPNIFKFVNTTPVKTPTNIDANEIQQCFYLSCKQKTLMKTTQAPDTAENKR